MAERDDNRSFTQSNNSSSYSSSSSGSRGGGFRGGSSSSHHHRGGWRGGGGGGWNRDGNNNRGRDRNYSNNNWHQNQQRRRGGGSGGGGYGSGGSLQDSRRSGGGQSYSPSQRDYYETGLNTQRKRPSMLSTFSRPATHEDLSDISEDEDDLRSMSSSGTNLPLGSKRPYPDDHDQSAKKFHEDNLEAQGSPYPVHPTRLALLQPGGPSAPPLPPQTASRPSTRPEPPPLQPAPPSTGPRSSGLYSPGLYSPQMTDGPASALSIPPLGGSNQQVPPPPPPPPPPLPNPAHTPGVYGGVPYDGAYPHISAYHDQVLSSPIASGPYPPAPLPLVNQGPPLQPEVLFTPLHTNTVAQAQPPVLPPPSPKREPMKSKEFYLLEMNKTDSEIAAVEHELQMFQERRKVALEELERQRGDHPDYEVHEIEFPANFDPSSDPELTKMLIKKIYSDNKEKAELSQPDFSHTDIVVVPSPNPNDYQSVKSVCEKARTFIPYLQKQLAFWKQGDLVRRRRLAVQYNTHRMRWMEGERALASSVKARAASEARKSFFKTVFPELKLEAQRGPRDLGQYLEVAAVVPDQLVGNERVLAGTFRSRNGIIEDSMRLHQELDRVNVWSDDEKSIFTSRFTIYPKKFHRIAIGVPNKTTAECVKFYYRTKKQMKYKEQVSRATSTRKKRKAAGGVDEDGMPLPPLKEWTVEEKHTFMKLLSEYGHKWNAIEAHMPGKTQADLVAYYQAHRVTMGLEKLASRATLEHSSSSSALNLPGDKEGGDGSETPQRGNEGEEEDELTSYEAANEQDGGLAHEEQSSNEQRGEKAPATSSSSSDSKPAILEGTNKSEKFGAPLIKIEDSSPVKPVSTASKSNSLKDSHPSSEHLDPPLTTLPSSSSQLLAPKPDPVSTERVSPTLPVDVGMLGMMQSFGGYNPLLLTNPAFSASFSQLPSTSTSFSGTPGLPYSLYPQLYYNAMMQGFVTPQQAQAYQAYQLYNLAAASRPMMASGYPQMWQNIDPNLTALQQQQLQQIQLLQQQQHQQQLLQKKPEEPPK